MYYLVNNELLYIHNIMKISILILFILAHVAKSFDSTNIVFTIISQSEPYHASVASRLKMDMENQIYDLEGREAKVHITHEDFAVPGAWTIIPLLRLLVTKYKGSDVRWVVFVEPHTAVRCGKLVDALGVADKQKETMWIGYPLSDDEPTIIHHFTVFEELEEDGGFVYPNFASGFAMRMELIESLVNKIESGERQLEADFSIDPAFELARLVYGSKEQRGPLLTPDLSFCVVSMDNCATYPRQFETCGSAISESAVYFAVKTWSGFHESRARVVKKTWGKHVTNLHFFSDLEDPTLPSTNLGIPNTKTGHCAKTIAILKEVLRRVEKMPQIKWIFLADDDTILGVRRLCEVLSCYRGGGDVTILGERYGYGYGKTETASKGYDYITGGGGTALSLGAARLLARCGCAATHAPDDMSLGACALRVRVPVTHSPLFHQVRHYTHRSCIQCVHYCAATHAPDDMSLGACALRVRVPVTHSPLFHQVRHYTHRSCIQCVHYCAATHAPDDMSLGACALRVRVPVTHSPLFHQVRHYTHRSCIQCVHYCAATHAPDDMSLGACALRVRVPVTHSPLFHQVRHYTHRSCIQCVHYCAATHAPDDMSLGACALRVRVPVTHSPLFHQVRHYTHRSCIQCVHYCAATHAPDDMSLGACALRVRVPVTHSPLFHQVRHYTHRSCIQCVHYCAATHAPDDMSLGACALRVRVPVTHSPLFHQVRHYTHRSCIQCVHYCAATHAPDDMSLGACALRVRVPVTHSPLFHQVRHYTHRSCIQCVHYCAATHAPDDMSLGACALRVRVPVTHSPLFHQVRHYTHRSCIQCVHYCAATHAPDDMSLGACALRVRVPVTHSPLFHQARPQDYPREVLARDRPVSFHRLPREPVKVYAAWFQHDDLALTSFRDEL
ncbi:uncharacterized protein LOC123691026 [Colias croceus]|uniref:uncharacterized protein LOC123691026 n=1 Tax=Colias crocea TaxID=72248 RepID=UPI001E27B3A7|nr:uncharacterized protein LOC123691026 [Colias croceus]